MVFISVHVLFYKKLWFTSLSLVLNPVELFSILKSTLLLCFQIYLLTQICSAECYYYTHFYYNLILYFQLVSFIKTCSYKNLLFFKMCNENVLNWGYIKH